MELKRNELEVQLELLEQTRRKARNEVNSNYEQGVRRLPVKGKQVSWVQFTDKDTLTKYGTVLAVEPELIPYTGNYAVFVRVESGGKKYKLLPHLITFLDEGGDDQALGYGQIVNHRVDGKLRNG